MNDLVELVIRLFQILEQHSLEPSAITSEELETGISDMSIDLESFSVDPLETELEQAVEAWSRRERARIVALYTMGRDSGQPEDYEDCVSSLMQTDLHPSFVCGKLSNNRAREFLKQGLAKLGVYN